jgi:gliding motility-associated-like protein
MKKYIFVYFALISFFSFSQQGNFVTEEEYRYKKSHDLLEGNEIIITDDMVNPDQVEKSVHFVKNIKSEKDACQGYTDPIGSPSSLSSSDDGSTAEINLPFNFCFFGDTYTSVYLNGNGNISFQSANAVFNASAFPSATVTMIAAFWADFDFGSCGDVYATVTPTAAIFNWVDAGYFNEQCDKVNTCQIIITDGTDPLIPGGNVAIHYADMQWTTGGASGGTNGFGGTPATAGANRGNGIDYFQIGQFDHAGTDYDGPNGSNDGVDFLDNRSFIFDFCNTTGGNLPPSAQNNNNCTPYQVCKQAGNELEIAFPFIGPENNQTISSITYNSPSLTSITEVSNTSGSGYTGILTLSIDGNLETLGMHDLTIEATDNLGAVTSMLYQIEVVDPNLAFPITPTVSLSQGCTPVTISIDNGPFDSYLWQDNSTTSSTTINSSYSGNFNVEVTNNGCKNTISTPVDVSAAPLFNLQGNLEFCPDDLNTYLFLPDSLNLDSAKWTANSSSLEISNLFSSNINSSGAYSITAYSFSAGAVCSSDTIINISVQDDLILIPDFITCENTVQLIGNTGGIGNGAWTLPSGVSLSPNNTNLNPEVTFSEYGTYTLSYTETGCQDQDEIIITWENPPFYNLPETLFSCPNSQIKVELEDSLNLSNVEWQTSTGGILSNNYSVSLSPGNYSLSISSLNGCPAVDTNFTINTQEVISLIPPSANNNKLCMFNIGDTLSIFASLGNSLDGEWSFQTLTGGTLNFLKDSATSIFTASEYGEYTITFTDNICQESDQVTLFIKPGAYFNIQDYKVCEGYTQLVEAFIDTPDEFIESLEWSNGQSGKSITVNSENNYILTMSTGCGDPFVDTSFVDYRICDIEMPNIFTPNGDGVNDTYVIKGDTEIFNEFNIIITNRWGNVITEYNDPSGVWDGTNNKGEIVEEGVYFYNVQAVTLQNEAIVKKGFIQVVKN